MSGIHRAVNQPKTSIAKKNAENGDRPDWMPYWPNIADLRYNYFNLLDKTKYKGIANITKCDASVQNKKIVIVGAGYAGTLAAKELLSAGYRNVTLIEGTDRVAGRAYTVLPRRKDGREDSVSNNNTPFEMGAMRIPFFTPETDGDEDHGNSIMQFMVDSYGVRNQKFPDPGSSFAETNTGIWMNGGYGPTPNAEEFLGIIDWQPTEEYPEPPTEALQRVFNAWSVWANKVIKACSYRYQEIPDPQKHQDGTDAWTVYWNKVIENYWLKNFRDVALAPVKDSTGDGDDYFPDGDFGGLGLTLEESTLFYTIGAGDGSWGAFYDVSALYPMRTLLFGFGTNHHLLGFIKSNKIPLQLYLEDNNGNKIQKPLFCGVAGIAEMNVFAPINSNDSDFTGKSFMQSCWDSSSLPYGPRFYSSSHVAKGDYDEDKGQFVLTVNTPDEVMTVRADELIITQTGWSFQMNTDWTTAFTKKMFIEGEEKEDRWSALTTWDSLKMSHNITSAKIFFKLKKRYWDDTFDIVIDENTGKKMPIQQVFVTDTFLQDVYGYVVDKKADGSSNDDDAGVLLASYTWEDDTNKYLNADDDKRREQLAMQCLDKIDEIMVEFQLSQGVSEANLKRMSDYVDFDYHPEVFNWAEQGFYRSCSKLYRAGTYNWNYALMSWNQNYGAEKNLFMAGEFASLTGGWLEPAMRGALDSVIHLVKATVPSGDWETVFTDYDMIQNYPRFAKNNSILQINENPGQGFEKAAD